MVSSKVHGIGLPGFDSLREAAETIGDLRYDALQALLVELSDKLTKDAEADRRRGRPVLAESLTRASRDIRRASVAVEDAWRVSKPHMVRG